MASELNTLLEKAEVIRTETTDNANDADRVGQLFKDIIEYLGKYQGSSGGSGGGGGSTPVDPSSITWEELNAAFLNANAADTANGRITFNRGFDATGPNNIYQQPGGEAGLYIYGNEDSDTAPLTVEGTDMDGISIYAEGDIVSEATMKCVESSSRTSTTHQAVIGPKLGTQTGVALTVNGDSNISGTLTVHDLEVTGTAHFMQLLIDQIKANEGAIIITCANCTASAVVASGLSRRVYFSAKNSTSAHGFVKGDYVICADFKAAHTGSMTDVSNKYYWTRVQGVSSTPTQTYVDTGDLNGQNIDEDGGYYHWILITASGADGVVNCEKGDDLIQLGYKAFTGDTPLTGDQLKAHQSAIVLSSYGYLLDKGLGNTPALTPPSLAFYQGIGNTVNGNAFNYNLTPYRTTFMDAKGTTIKGAFIAESTLDSGTAQVSVEAYTLKCESNPITAPSSGTKAVEFRVLHTIDGEGTFLNNDTVEDYSVVLYATVIRNGHSVTPEVSFSSGKFSFDIGPDDTKLNADLLFRIEGESDILKDHFTADIVSFDNITDGINGDKIERVYKKVNAGDPISNPESLDEAWSDFTDGEKNGWAPWDPSIHYDEEGKYLYETSRLIYFVQGGGAHYRGWEGPLRYTGTKGDPGTPGSQGNDGPGYKTIFARIAPSEVNNYPSGPTFRDDYPDSPSDHDELGYYKADTTLQSRKWYDDPISPIPTADTYVSQSTTYTDSNNNRTWSNWSKPALYTLYSEGAIQYKLIAFAEVFEVKITKKEGSTGVYEDLIGALNVNLNYGIATIDGDSVVYNDKQDSHDFKVTITCNGSSIKQLSGKTYTASPKSDSNPIVMNSASGGQYSAVSSDGRVSYTNTNFLGVINAMVTGTGVEPDDGRNYYKLAEYGFAGDAPSMLTLKLYKSGNVVDTRTIELLFKADGVFMTTKAALTSVYQGMGGTGEYGFSRLQQRWNGITASVASVETGLTTTNTNVSALQIQANSIATSVTNVQNELHNSYSTTTQTQSMISQSASNISMHVKSSGSWNFIKNPTFDVSDATQLPQDGTLERYVFIKVTTPNYDTKPVGDITSTTTNPNTWTKTRLSANAFYPYVHYSKGTRSSASSNWSWSDPKLYAFYDNEHSVYALTPRYWGRSGAAIGSSQYINYNNYINYSTATQYRNTNTVRIDMRANPNEDQSGVVWEAVHLKAPHQLNDKINDSDSSLKLEPEMKIMTSVWIMIEEGQVGAGLADSVVGMDFGNNSGIDNVFYTRQNTGIEKEPKIYVDDQLIPNNGGGGNSNRQYAQFNKLNDNENLTAKVWHKIDIIWTVKNSAELDQFTFCLYGWRDPRLESSSEYDAEDQPVIYFNYPQLYLLDDNGMILEKNLSNTGIDIEQGKITLQADKVTFCDSNGENRNKISINPSTGALNAIEGNFVNGNFSGVVTANSLYSPWVKLSKTPDVTETFLNPSEASHFYLNSPSINVTWEIRLPDPNSYKGIELTLWWPVITGLTVGTIQVRYVSPIIYHTVNSAYAATDVLTLAPNKMMHLMSVPSPATNNQYQWYIMSGRFEVNGVEIDI